eukprot:TRINITY_DN1857_c0_g1_i1.p1 TRINITY_DN1857_c0_g1~~TRINITY_DN1857_c0_g1_i1.p1  ORF type:complete len:682 (+),score=148.80 TRINITY_DN1857_c0_g1_i1:44-2047(+)
MSNNELKFLLFEQFNDCILEQKSKTNYDNVLLDMNPIFESILNKQKSVSYELFCVRLIKKLETTLLNIRPNKTLMLGLDGPSTSTKIQEQHQRCLDVMKEKEFFNFNWRSHELITSLHFIPGTIFMDKISQFLRYYFAVLLKRAQYPTSKFFYIRDIKICISDSREPGEVKHKFVTWIKNYSDMKENTLIFTGNFEFFLYLLPLNNRVSIFFDAEMIQIQTNSCEYDENFLINMSDFRKLLLTFATRRTIKNVEENGKMCPQALVDDNTVFTTVVCLLALCQGEYFPRNERSCNFNLSSLLQKMSEMFIHCDDEKWSLGLILPDWGLNTQFLSALLEKLQSEDHNIDNETNDHKELISDEKKCETFLNILLRLIWMYFDGTPISYVHRYPYSTCPSISNLICYLNTLPKVVYLPNTTSLSKYLLPPPPELLSTLIFTSNMEGMCLKRNYCSYNIKSRHLDQEETILPSLIEQTDIFSSQKQNFSSCIIISYVGKKQNKDKACIVEPFESYLFENFKKVDLNGISVVSSNYNLSVSLKALGTQKQNISLEEIAKKTEYIRSADPCMLMDFEPDSDYKLTKKCSFSKEHLKFLENNQRFIAQKVCYSTMFGEYFQIYEYHDRNWNFSLETFNRKLFQSIKFSLKNRKNWIEKQKQKISEKRKSFKSHSK